MVRHRRWIMRRSGFLLSGLAVMIALVTGARVWATRDSVAGCRFSGPARLHLAPAPTGTGLEAWVDGQKVAETVVTTDNAESVYTLTLGPQYTGKTVVFRFAGYPQLGQAGQAVCELGKQRALTLDGQALGGCGGGP